MKKVLAISNSFGVDANRYLYGISRSAGQEIKIVTLFIGGCSLYRHYRNMLSGEKAYALYVNGMATGFSVSLKEALLSDEWDVVTYQQVSDKSGFYESYFPYLKELDEYVKKHVPGAKRFIHAIWGWSDAKLVQGNGPFKTSAEMYSANRDAYDRAGKEISADGYIPSISAMQKLYEKIGERVYRDGYHANLGVARYMLGLVWYMTLFGKSDVDAVKYSDFDIPVSDEDKKIAEQCALSAVLENQ